MKPMLNDTVEIYNINSGSVIDVAGDSLGIVGAIPRIKEVLKVQNQYGISRLFVVKNVEYIYYDPNENIPGFNGVRVFLKKITIYCEEID